MLIITSPKWEQNAGGQSEVATLLQYVQSSVNPVEISNVNHTVLSAANRIVPSSFCMLFWLRLKLMYGHKLQAK